METVITAEETAELERLLAAAQGWDIHPRLGLYYSGDTPPIAESGCAALCEFAIAARNHATAFLAAARQAEAKDARIAELEEALKPFAVAGALTDTYRTKMSQKRLHDNAETVWPFVPKIGDLRRADRLVSPSAARLADPSPNSGGGGAG